MAWTGETTLAETRLLCVVHHWCAHEAGLAGRLCRMWSVLPELFIPPLPYDSADTGDGTGVNQLNLSATRPFAMAMNSC